MNTHYDLEVPVQDSDGRKQSGGWLIDPAYLRQITERLYARGMYQLQMEEVEEVLMIALAIQGTIDSIPLPDGWQ